MAEADFISSKEAARKLGYTRQHVGRLVREGKLAGHKIGRDWMVKETSVKEYAVSRANHRLDLSTAE